LQILQYNAYFQEHFLRQFIQRLIGGEFLAVFVKGKKMQGISVLPALSASARLYRDSRNADYGCDWKCGMRFATSASRFWPIDLEHTAIYPSCQKGHVCSQKPEQTSSPGLWRPLGKRGILEYAIKGHTFRATPVHLTVAFHQAPSLSAPSASHQLRQSWHM
jgi:hypothetical protein